MEKNLPIDARIAVTKDNWWEAHVEIISVMKANTLLPPDIPPSLEILYIWLIRKLLRGY